MCFRCLHFFSALRVFFFTYLRDFMSFTFFHFLKCLTCIYSFTCLKCIYFLRAFIFLPYVAMKFGTTQDQLQQAEICKSKYFVSQNLDIFNFKLLLRKQPLWGIVFRILWSKSLKNILEFIMCSETKTLRFFRDFESN